MPSAESLAKKEVYFTRLHTLLDTYKRVIVVEADNVGSNQIQSIRIALRGRAELLFGKNTMMRKAIRVYIDRTKSRDHERLLNTLAGNVGFVFTNEDLAQIRDIIEANRRPAPARPGTIAPVDVVLPAQNTGMEPTKTSFFQALSIPTKINKGAIEIISDVHLIKKGDKVGTSEATLLKMLDVKPFTFGLELSIIYDEGWMYEPRVLDITEEDVAKVVQDNISNIAAISLAIGYATAASIPHVMVNAFKDLVAVAVETGYEMEAAKELIYRINHPEEFAAAAPAAAPAAGAKEEAREEAKEEEDEDESDEDMGFSLFD